MEQRKVEQNSDKMISKNKDRQTSILITILLIGWGIGTYQLFNRVDMFNADSCEAAQWWTLWGIVTGNIFIGLAFQLPHKIKYGRWE